MSVYEYYKYGGLVPWIIDTITRMITPGIYYAFFYFMIFGTNISIPGLLPIIFPAIETMRMIILFFRKLPLMIMARKSFAEIMIPDHLIRCTHWRNIAIKMAEKRIIETEKDFCVTPGSIDAILIDLFLEKAIPNDITDTSIGILKEIIHRSMRSNSSIKISIAIQTFIEIFTWPYQVFIRTMGLMYIYIPRFYSSFSSVVSRSFIPSIKYRYRGYYELEFDTIIRIEHLQNTMNEFMAEFPNPTVEVTAGIMKHIIGMALVWFFYYWNIKMMMILLPLLGVVNSIKKVSGSYNPSKNFDVIAQRFELNPDNPVYGREFCLSESDNTLMMIFSEIFTIVFMPLYCIVFFRHANDIQHVTTKRLVPISGVPGFICSNRMYKHVAFIESDDYYFGADNWISRSTADLEKEYSALIRRVQDKL